MAKLMLVDEGGIFFISIVEGTTTLGRASMGRRELELAARRFRQAALTLQAREPCVGQVIGQSVRLLPS